MKQKSSRYKIALVCLVLLVLPLFSMYFHGRLERPQSLVETALLSATAPGQRFMHGTLYRIVSAWKRYVFLVGAEDQNEQLRESIEDLRMRASRARSLEEENYRLRLMLEFKTGNTQLDLLSATVIARKSTPFFAVSMIELDRGTADQVRPDMPVVTAAGLVGRIEKVAGDYCDLMLLTDTRSRVDVQVAGKGVNGMLVGRGDSMPVFRFPFQKADFEKGDLLISTGHDRLYPKGLVVGTLSEDVPKQVGQKFEVPVDPAVRFPALQEVFIVVNQVHEKIPGGE